MATISTPFGSIPRIDRCTNPACDEVEPPWEPYKKCAKCHTQKYCSRECQRADWKAHKKICGKQQSEGSGRAPTDFDAMGPIAGQFFKELVKDDYLHQFTEKDAFCQLIDCYRMRVEDDYVHAHENRGIYANEDPVPDFKHFLNEAERRNGLLPAWWTPKKRTECERLAIDETQWCDIKCAVEKKDIMEHYNDNQAPMKLRLLAEKIYGYRINGGL
ncbi:MAG: hypothetical protein Q9164_007211 [Protoblastenia rupestris]